MVDEYEIDTNKFEWAVFLFNIMGEDKSYFVDLYKIQNIINEKPINRERLVETLFHFLNNWGMRLSKKLDEEKSPAAKINKWYNEEVEKLNYLYKDNIIDINLNTTKVTSYICKLYSSLCEIDYIKDTSASKILHMLNPKLFVMWDNTIRIHYIKDPKKNKGSEEYISFLKEIQIMANQLKNNNMDSDYLFSKIKDPMEKNLENFLSKKGMKEDKEKIIKFAKQNKKTMAKFIDEYNWIVYTKKIPLPPSWHP